MKATLALTLPRLRALYEEYLIVTLEAHVCISHRLRPESRRRAPAQAGGPKLPMAKERTIHVDPILPDENEQQIAIVLFPSRKLWVWLASFES